MAEGLYTRVALPDAKLEPRIDQYDTGVVTELKPVGKYYKVSPGHERSHDTEQVDEDVYRDKFGNDFTAVSLKGLPPVGKWPYLEQVPGRRGFRTHYLFDTFEAGDFEDISGVLRQKHLPTEVIVDYSKLHSLRLGSVLGEKWVPVNDLKTKMRANFLRRNPGLGIEDKEKLASYLNGAEYFVVQRRLPVSERIRDFWYVLHDFKSRAARRFTANLNRYFIPAGRPLLDHTPKSYFDYLTDRLPQEMGRYLGGFHLCHLYHGSASFRNWLAIGALVDLDSVQNLPRIASDTVTPDLTEAYLEFYRSFSGYAFEDFFSANGLIRRKNKSAEGEGLAVNASVLFLHAYTDVTGLSFHELSKHRERLFDVLLDDQRR